MATIRLAYDSKAYVPIHGMSRSAFLAAQNNGIQATLSRGPGCYASEANLAFTGISGGWDIIFSGKSIKGAWAAARIDSWGRGVVYWSTHAQTLKNWKTYPSSKIQGMISSLVGHECGHILLCTNDQSVGIPLTPAMRSRLRSHWGEPRTRSADLGAVGAGFSRQGLSTFNRVRNWQSMTHVMTFEEFELADSEEDGG